MRKRLIALSAGVAGAALLGPVVALAQEADISEGPINSADAFDDRLSEAIIVTGTRIRGVEPVGSNVVSIGAVEIARTPAANVTDLLRRLPQVGGAGINEAISTNIGPGTSSTNATRTGSINLRGIGPKATLVLFDGQRFSGAGLNGAEYDPTVVPSAVLERIEVVADGASAIYGSDAVAGVVNFVPRTRFDGVEARVRYSHADAYSQDHVSLLGGKTWGSGGFILAVQRDFNTNLNGTDRDFLRSDLRPQGGRDFRSTQCAPGNILIGSTSYAIPAGGVTPATAAQLVPGTRNLCEEYRNGDILARQERYAGYAGIEQEIGIARLYARGFYSERKFRARDTRQGSTAGAATFTVPSSNAFFVAPPGTNPSSYTVEYNFAPNGLVFYGKSRYYQITGGSEFKLSPDWTVTLNGNYAKDDDEVHTAGILSGELNARVASSDPNVAFNPFGPFSETAAQSLLVNGFEPTGHSRVSSAQVNVSGRLFDLPGGPLRLAFGGDYSWYKFNTTFRRGDLRVEVPITTTNASRQVKSVYGELLIPVFSDANETSLFHSLDVSLALRYDDYSDVGSTTNPKVGVNWSPVRGLVLKGSYGKSFKAPYLSEVLSPKSGASMNVVTASDETGASLVGLSINDGNPGLRPEKAETYSFTAELKPVGVPGLALSGTFFSVDYQQQIGGVPSGVSALLNPLYAPFVIRNPTLAQVQQISTDLGLPINGVLPAAVGFIIDTRVQNLGGSLTQGLEFAGSYDFSSDWGDFLLSLTANRLTRYDVQLTPVAPIASELGAIYTPPKFRARGELNWIRDWFSAAVIGNHYGSYDNTLARPVQRVDSFTTFDLRLAAELPDSSRILAGTSIALEFTNVFDKRPPFVDVQGGVDPSAASLIGRMVTLTVQKRF